MWKRLFARTKPEGMAQKLPQAADPASLPGRVINQRYRIESEIGHGGMGVVYRAIDQTNGQAVALKLFELAGAGDLTRQQLARELEIAVRLKHPHIVAAQETGLTTDGQTPYLVMELIQGNSLEALGRLTFERVVEIGVQICAALAYAHEMGIIHRDLKPANILIERRGFQYWARLVDFGLARLQGSEDLPGESSLAGTILYLAPEVISGQSANISSDLYSLGVTLYEMVTGRVPFSAFDDRAIYQQHLNELPAPPSQSRPDIPPRLEAVILRLLDKDPARRFASAVQVSEALAESLPINETNIKANSPFQSEPALTGAAEAIRAQLQAGRVLTLLDGAAATARQTASLLAAEFSGGMKTLDLQGLADPSQLVSVVREQLDAPLEANRPPVVALVDYLHERHLLLLFLNCEHLIPACAQLVAAIQRACPEVYCLIVSSVPLNIPVEQTVRLADDRIFTE